MATAALSASASVITFFNYCYQEEDKSESPAVPVYFPGVGGIGGGVLSGPDQASSLTAQYQGEMESASSKKTVVAAPAADAMLADTDDDEDDSESMSSWELHRKAERVSTETLRLEQPVILLIVVDTHCLVLHGTHTIMGGCDSEHVRFTEIECCQVVMGWCPLSSFISKTKIVSLHLIELNFDWSNDTSFTSL